MQLMRSHYKGANLPSSVLAVEQNTPKTLTLIFVLHRSVWEFSLGKRFFFTVSQEIDLKFKIILSKCILFNEMLQQRQGLIIFCLY